MIIEIRKAGFVNKGAHMMLLTIVQKIRDHLPDATITMAPTTEVGSQPFSKLVTLNIKPLFRLRRKRFDISFLGNLIPKKIRNAYGIVLDKEVNFILDASGFSYSDQWGMADLQELLHALKRSKALKQRFIFLPQAFGPFQDMKVRKLAKEAFSLPCTIYARDFQSHGYVRSVVSEKVELELCPDFTASLRPRESELNYDGYILIVPNFRMIDKGCSADSYSEQLVAAISYLQEKNQNVLFLIHEAHLDRALAEEVNRHLTHAVPIVHIDDPAEIKHLILKSKYLISSRYHACVSALCQGIPVIGTSWSHKYQALYEEYGCTDLLVNQDQTGTMIQLINKLDDSEYYEKTADRLNKHADEVLEQIDRMWEQVFDGLQK